MSRQPDDQRVQTSHPPDLSWAERPLRGLLSLAWPMAISWLSYAVMTLVDTLFVSRLGSAALAGVGLGGILCFALLCFPMGLLQGAKVLVSQAVGAGRHHRVAPYLGAALVVAIALGGLTLALGQAVARFVPLLAASDGAGAAAGSYFLLRVLGSPLFLLAVALKEVRQGLGDARNPMLATVVANIVNIGLDYALIFGLGLGVSGAALATVVANGVEAAVLLGVQHGLGGLTLRRTSPGDLGALWALGWPTGVQFLVEMGSFTLLSVLVSRYGELDMAAHQIALQVLHFSFLPALALGEANSVLVGQAVGAGQVELVRRVSRLALATGGIYAALCSAGFVLGAPAIVRAFTDDPELSRVTVRLLIVAAIFQVLDAANVIGRCALRGTGDVRFPAVVGTLAAWLITPPAMWLLGYRLGLGALGGWIGFCAELLVISLLFWWRLERGGWRRAMERARAVGGLTTTPQAGAGA